MNTTEAILHMMGANLLPNKEAQEQMPPNPNQPLIISTKTLSRLRSDVHAAQKLMGYKSEVLLTLPAVMELIQGIPKEPALDPWEGMKQY